VLTPILGRQRVTVWAGWATHDALPLTASVGGRLFPRPVVDHRAFDGKHTAVMVGDDEVERLVWIVSGHAGAEYLCVRQYWASVRPPPA